MIPFLNLISFFFLFKDDATENLKRGYCIFTNVKNPDVNQN